FVVTEKSLVNTMNKPWLLANTTVRNPERLHNGLRVISEAGLEGSLSGGEGGDALARALAEAGVVTLKGDHSASIGSKWRNGLNKLGAIWVALPDDEPGIEKYRGQPDHITPQGRR